MKALTLHQPWATLIALGVKTIETRSWRTSYRGPLAIHAGTTRPPMMHLPPLPPGHKRRDAVSGYWTVIDTITDPAHQRPHRPDERIPKRSKTPTLFWPKQGPYARIWDPDLGTSATDQGTAAHLPLGAVVATCTLTDCVPIGGPESFRTGTFEGDAGDFPGEKVLVYHPACITAGPTAHHEALILDDPTTFRHDFTDQIPFGDYSDGRWGWLLEGIEPLPEPVPARGHQGLWEWETDTPDK